MTQWQVQDSSHRPTADDPQTAPFDVEVFFDGECPLCSKEIRLLRRLDKGARIRFTDISASSFSPAAVGKTMNELMAHIHGRLPDGTVIEGVEVFRRLYDAVGFRRLVRATRWAGVRHVLDFAYERFAKNRLRFSGRCTPELCAGPRHAPGHSHESHPRESRTVENS